MQSSEIVYYYDDELPLDGARRVQLFAEWHITLHLPIHCKRCSAYFDLNDMLGGKLGRSTLDLFPRS